VCAQSGALVNIDLHQKMNDCKELRRQVNRTHASACFADVAGLMNSFLYLQALLQQRDWRMVPQ
jgi:hypothetical protein